MRKYFLRNTGLRTGLAVAALCGAFAFLVLTIVTALLFDGTSNVLLVINLSLAFLAFRWVFNHGLINVPKEHRALLFWLNRPMLPDKGGPYEIREGRAWLPKAFGLASFEAYNMEKPDPAKLPPIEIETQNETEVPTKVAVYYRPRPGHLDKFRMVKNVVEQFTPVTNSVGRAFGIKQESVDDLVENGPQMEDAMLEVLRRRADGYNTPFSINANKVEFDRAFGERDYPPWGIIIEDVEIVDFDIPKSITAASANVIVAEKNAKAGEVQAAAIEKLADRLSRKGADRTASLALATALAAPQVVSPIQVQHHSVDRNIADAAFAAFRRPQGVSDGPRQPRRSRREG